MYFTEQYSRLLLHSCFKSEVTAVAQCEDRVGTGPPRARTQVNNVDLGYRAISGSRRAYPDTVLTHSNIHRTRPWN